MCIVVNHFDSISKVIDLLPVQIRRMQAENAAKEQELQLAREEVQFIKEEQRQV